MKAGRNRDGTLVARYVDQSDMSGPTECDCCPRVHLRCYFSGRFFLFFILQDDERNDETGIDLSLSNFFPLSMTDEMTDLALMR